MKTCRVWRVSGLGVSRRGKIKVQIGYRMGGCRKRCVLAVTGLCVLSPGPRCDVGVRGRRRSWASSFLPVNLSHRTFRGQKGLSVGSRTQCLANTK